MKRSADALDADAQCDLGHFYKDGVGIDVDLNAAVSWWCRAAAQGHSGAMCALGDYYLNGDGVLANDDGTAFSWYTRAAAAAVPDAAALFSLGVCYEHACGVAEDARAAAAHFSRAAEEGHIGAMEAFADCFDRGYGVERSDERAAEWRALAFEADDEGGDGDANEEGEDEAEEGEDEADEDEGSLKRESACFL